MSERTVGVRQFRENLSTYLAEVAAGQPLTIVSRGKAIAEVNPPTRAKRPPPTFGALKGKMWMADDWDTWDAEELASFERDPCDI